jgi:head-tail adaptor
MSQAGMVISEWTDKARLWAEVREEAVQLFSVLDVQL